MSGPLYRERLTVPAWWWLAAPGLAALFAAEIFLGAPGLATALPYVLLIPAVVVGLWWFGRVVVAVTDDRALARDLLRAGARVVAPTVLLGLLGR